MAKDYTFGNVSERAFNQYFTEVGKYLERNGVSIRADLLAQGETVKRANYLQGLYNRVKRQAGPLTYVLVGSTLHMLTKPTIGLVGMEVLAKIESENRLSEELLSFERYVLKCLTPEEKEYRRKRRKVAANMALQEAYRLGL